MGALDCISVRITPTDSTEVFPVNGSSIALDKTRRDIESQLLQCDLRGRRHSVWWSLGIDLPLFLIVATLLALQEMGVFPQHKSGFFCNDPALSYSYNGDTVSMTVIISTIIACPLILMFATELLISDVDVTVRTKMCQSAKESLLLFRGYSYGLIFNLAIIEVMKGITGNPRPTFFDICEPDTAKICNGSEYVRTFECTSSRFSAWFQMDSYHSFPSGHTSLSVYCGLYMAWYLQKRAFDWSHRSVFVVPVLQLLCVTYSVVCSLTRITDRRHHWWDVVTGTVVGVICLVYTAVILCDNFKVFKKENKHDRSTTTSHSNRTSIYDSRLQGPLT